MKAYYLVCIDCKQSLFIVLPMVLITVISVHIASINNAMLTMLLLGMEKYYP